MSVNSAYTVVVKGPGVSVEGEVEKAIGDKIVYMVLTGAIPAVGGAQVAPSESQVPAQNGGVDPAESVDQSRQGRVALREFLNDCGPKRVIDKIAAIAVYKKRHEGENEFSRETLVAAFESAAEVVPKNLSRDLRSARGAGWIAEKTGAKGMYYVTDTGENVVKQKFPKDLVSKTKAGGGGTRGRKKAWAKE